MNTEFDYYYNNVPGKGLCRNNLIYTSLISKDRKTFCKWYHNDEIYHGGHNEVVDPLLMEEKWNREIKFLSIMTNHYPMHVPLIKDIDYKNRKLYLEISDVDFWEQSNCNQLNYDTVLPDWKEQMLEIIQAHAVLGIYKYSVHPSSYFITKQKLKSINYFFCYTDADSLISLTDVMSHISISRRKDLLPKMKLMGIDVDQPTSFLDIQKLAFESFKTDFPIDIMDQACSIYKNTMKI
jgi:hypothetical protein